MLSVKYHNLLLWSATTSFVVITLAHLSINYMNLDVSWLLYCATRILKGAILYKDIFETNPPLAVYFNFPAIWLAQWLKISLITSFYFYFFGIVLLAVGLSWKLIPIVWDHNNALLITGLRLLIVFVSLIMALHIFGQREHFTFLLTMPYVFLTIIRAQGKTFSPAMAAAIGCLAGLGIAIKPHFSLLWIGLESYLCFVVRAQTPYWRPESCAIILINIFYSLLIILFFPEYFNIIKLLSKYYFAYDNNILTSKKLILLLLSAFLSLVILYRMKYKNNNILYIIFITFISFLLSAILQKKGWPNHLFPGLAWLILFSYLIMLNLFEQSKVFHQQKNNICFTIILLITVILIVFSSFITFKSINSINTSPLPQLISLVNENASNRPIYVLTTHLYPSFPLVIYSQTSWPYHFHSLWPLPGIYYSLSRDPGAMQAEIDRQWFNTIVTTDLVKYQPALIIVDNTSKKIGFKEPFDLLDYFNYDNNFKEIFSNYILFRIVNNYKIYKNKSFISALDDNYQKNTNSVMANDKPNTCQK